MLSKTDEAVLALYKATTMSVSQIARVLDVSSKRVRGIVLRYELALR